MYLIFDTETTGLPQNYNAPLSDSDNWPRCVQIAWQLHASDGSLIENQNHIVKPEGFTIPYNAEKVHGISTERAMREGKDLREVLALFSESLQKTSLVVGHNIEFDINIMGAEYLRCGQEAEILTHKKSLDTKDASTEFCAIPGGKGGKFKWPTLTELHKKLFGVGFDDAHDAAYDVDATGRCFFGLLQQGVVKPFDGRDLGSIQYEAPVLDLANFAAGKDTPGTAADVLKVGQKVDISGLEAVNFSHLHCHTQYSILQSTSDISGLIAKAKSLQMPAIAMTDHGNMMGAFHFVKEALKQEIKPILGCEFNLCRNRNDKTQKDDGYQTVLLAKNKAGYHHLAKLASIAYTEGFYYLPRIDREVLVRHKEHLIATTGGLWGEIPYLILNVGDQQAEEAFVWWKEQFGEDFYVELNRHGMEEENRVNDVLMGFAQKYGVKYFAANNTYYSNREDARAHDILLCVKDGETMQKPKRYIGRKGREFRFGFPNDEFYLKTPEEMKLLFHDLPQAIECTQEIVDKIETYKLAREVLLPKFDIPAEFIHPEDALDKGKRGENAYLKHLTYEGAKRRYKEITPEIQERLDFELATIEMTGYPGYFLIVQDFCNAAREMGVSVGPGRGSAAGSAVAYCIGITNVDPIAYDLLFERFLNPDRVSLPDIDIDFDDEGRQRVIDYVIQKYGANQVAQIITYGTMAGKSAIRDTARVLELPLSEADRLAKLVPDIKLKELFSLAKDKTKLSDKLKNNNELIQQAEELLRIAQGQDDQAKTLNQAKMLEGSVRNTGIHACGVIITPEDISNLVPIAVAKDSDMACTQFDNSVVESAGLLKMDFLGLKTLTLIKDTIKIIKERHGITLDPETVPIDDEKTYELFQRGETVGIFQYESTGMQKYLRDLKPTVFADLIAMNALYRPGPLEYIPSFVRRKHGQEPITYDIPDAEEYLKETYGITVYQEQVMLLAQKLAGFTKGEADVLRKAMGKKIFALLDELKPKFINQGMERGHAQDKLEKMWKDWEAFAAYAFNKSHSTCYAWIAYQTAYLKAHYPAEYMAAVLSNNMNQITEVTFFMEECRRMGLQVLGPDVNESKAGFTVNKAGQIRFGMAAIKGAGEAAVWSIIEEREKKGIYKDIFDFAERINLRSVNKKTFEVLAMAGAFDCFPDINRRQYLEAPADDLSVIEKVIKFAQKTQMEKESAQVSLFGGVGGEEIPRPKIPAMEPFSNIMQLNIEKEVVGLYISGHPLDAFRLELSQFCNAQMANLTDMAAILNQDLRLAGIVTGLQHRTTKTGKPFGSLTLEDYSGSFQFMLFGDDYMKFKNYMVDGAFLYIRGKSTEQKWGNRGPEFKIQSIDLLHDIREKLCKSIHLSIATHHVNEELIAFLEDVLTSHKGQCQVKVNIVDTEENIVVEMLAKRFRINPENAFLEKLKSRPELEMRLN